MSVTSILRSNTCEIPAVDINLLMPLNEIPPKRLFSVRESAQST